MSAFAPIAQHPQLRLIAASFAAGVGAMTAVALAATLVAEGGLGFGAAEASSLEPEVRPVIVLDVAAVEAQLAKAEAEMARAQAATNDEMAQLARLSR